ncbi:MAG: hypothetical protein JWP02_1335, partial [Acidimicrobiales bacterium]|nr:hypothetical protein [Acidimicrobiales bacterium]
GKLIRDAVRKGRVNVKAPTNIKVAKNVAGSGHFTVSRARQDVEINQDGGGGEDGSRED